MASERGWSALVAEPWPRGEPFPAYSEFMPAPQPAVKATGAAVGEARVDGDDHGWRITAREATHELGPGLDALADALASRLVGLVDGDAHTRGLSRDLIDGNPYLPDVALPPGPLVAVVGLALSRTQDDKGRVRWTLLGASDLGPGPAFWSGFRTGPADDDEDDDATAAARLAPLLAPFGVRGASVASLHKAGVRILPTGDDPRLADERLPRALARLVTTDADVAGPAVRAVVTFRPWARLPAALRRAARAGAIALVPSPVSLAFAGHRGYRALADALPGAMQLPLLRAVPMTLRGLRVPQSGWIDQGGHAGPVTHGAHRERVKRTHRWQRVRRDADDTAAVDYDDRVADALFATTPTALGLYDKPLAKNAQVWTHDYRLVLDGPRADRAALAAAARTVASGGHFGYRFHWLPMRVGAREVIWHRPLAFVLAAPDAAPTRVSTSDGVLHATRDGAAPIALWPRADDRAPWLALERAFPDDAEARHDVRKLLDARARLGAPLPRALATRLVSADRDATWSAWRTRLAARAADVTAARVVTAAIDRTLAARDASPPPPLTFAHTATRAYEQRYWRTIAGLAHATWRAKNNADGAAPSAPRRDLDGLADELARRHAAAIARHGLTGRAAVAHHWFRWTTDFDLPWSHGWAKNQLHGPSERNVICMIPGRDRSRAFVLADHYDTAYMEDVYDGRVRSAAAGTRHAAAGADDNHSATAALLLAADVFLPMAAAGQLAHDVWLVHLTGEEFPGDSLGARHLARALVDRTLVVHEAGTDRPIDLRHVTIAGAIVMDMIAHRDPRTGDRFQIAPGDGAAAMATAAAVHRATQAWNHGAARWNRTPARAAARPYRRRARGTQVPAIAPHPTLVGELRPHWHWSSTVFNTDAQCWSDLGLPIVLLMEHYDIDRTGYHDTQDTLANIDLDFGAAVSAVAIETIASLATAAPRSRAHR